MLQLQTIKSTYNLFALILGLKNTAIHTIIIKLIKLENNIWT